LWPIASAERVDIIFSKWVHWVRTNIEILEPDRTLTLGVLVPTPGLIDASLSSNARVPGGALSATALAVVVIGIVGVLCASARADTTDTWSGGIGSWESNFKWSNGLPNNGHPTGSKYDVVIDGQPSLASNVTVVTSVAVSALQLDSGDILNLNAGSQLTTSTLSNAGTIFANAGGRFSASSLQSAASFNGRLVANGGAITVLGTYTVGSNQAISLQNGGVVTLGVVNTNGYGINVPSGCSLTAQGLTNAGGTVQGSGLVTLNSLTNSGGQLQFAGNAVVGTYGGFSGVSLNNVGGSVSLSDNASWSIQDSTTVSGGTWSTSGSAAFNAQGIYWYAAPHFSDLTLNGTLNAGTNVWFGGTILNNGVINLNAGYQYAAGSTLVLNGSGTINVSGNFEPGLSPPVNLKIVNQGNTIQGAGYFNYNVGGAISTVQNDGIIQALPNSSDPNGRFAVGGNIVLNQADGVLRATSGSNLYIRTAQFTSTGIIDVKANATMQITGYDINSTAAATSIENAGILNFNQITASVGTITGGRLWVNGFGAVTLGNMNVSALQLDGPGTVILQPQTPGTLITLGTSTPRMFPTNVMNSLSITNGGGVDVTNTGFVVNYDANLDPISSIGSYIKLGYNHGAWSNAGSWRFSGVTSSFAATNHAYGVGYADSAEGVVSGLPAGSILVECALYGDTNMDGVVDFADLLNIASHSGGGVTDWAAGDFNYDGVTDVSDLVLMAENFDQTLTPLQREQLPAPFLQQWDSATAENPEPAYGVAFLLSGLAGLSFRNRTRNRSF
jgi:hypothetical protein